MTTTDSFVCTNAAIVVKTVKCNKILLSRNDLVNNLLYQDAIITGCGGSTGVNGSGGTNGQLPAIYKRKVRRNTKIAVIVTFDGSQLDVNSTDDICKHGLCHLIITKGNTNEVEACTQVIMCLDSVTIDASSKITMVYYGFLNKSFDFHQAYIDTCFSFMIKASAPTTLVNNDINAEQKVEASDKPKLLSKNPIKNIFKNLLRNPSIRALIKNPANTMIAFHQPAN